MAIASFIDLTEEQQKAYKKALRKYQGTKSAIVSTPYKKLSREEIKERKNRQWMTEISAVWKTYTSELKATWKANAQNIHRTGWSLYMQEYCYRKKYDLSYPPDPTEEYQMYGMLIRNPDGAAIVKAERYDISLMGKITIKFAYKKTENEVTAGEPFKFNAVAWYMDAGENKSESQIFEAPAGNVGWTEKEFTFGTTNRYYFELIVTFELNNYDAEVKLDNFVVTDSIGTAIDEPFHIKAGKNWEYQIRTRKMGWEFSPNAGQPYFEIIYLGE